MRVLWSWLSPSPRRKLSDCHHLNPCTEPGIASSKAAPAKAATRAARRVMRKDFIADLPRIRHGAPYCLPQESMADTPRASRNHLLFTSASTRRMTASTRLSGVDAPDVRPTVTSTPSGSQPEEISSSLASTGLCL